MMGLTVADPYGVEGEPRTAEGLGLLPVHTVLAKEKTTVRRRMRYGEPDGPWIEGYEIHMGVTETDSRPGRPLNFPGYDGEAAGAGEAGRRGKIGHGGEAARGSEAADGEAAGRGEAGHGSEAADGYRLSGSCWGTYLHGILDNRVVMEELLHQAGIEGVQLPDYRAFKERQYDRLADHLRQHLDIHSIYKQLARS
jgi:adenosylcobyric acid synthase